MPNYNLYTYPQPIGEEEEKKLILREYRTLLRLLKYKIQEESSKRRIHEAFKIAADAHKSMRRSSGEPYILHPIEVAKICVKEIGLGTRSVISALLHDVVEDTSYSITDIKKKFGSEIASIVAGLTKINIATSAGEVESNQADNFKRILLSIVDDPRIIFIKLADRLHNMRTLHTLKREKQLKISAETLYIYAPLAHRLGFNTLKMEMEDLSFKCSYPDEYENIHHRLQETRMQRTRFIAHFVRPIKEVLNQDSTINYQISGRPKSIYSIWCKMKAKNISFDEVFDLFAIRVIIKECDLEKEEIEKCWKVYSIISNMYRPVPGRMRDWLSLPKSNGYKALHLTVLTPKGIAVEVQIRSERMNDIAEQGMAAHWKYKENIRGENIFDAWLKRIRMTIKSGTLDSNSVSFLVDFKNNFLSDEIYVFTTKGEIKMLPSGASVLDFAYLIHSDIGNQCFAAKVNSKLVSINYQPTSGDRVEIITSTKQVPKIDWMNYVITSKAKSKIKEALNIQKKKIAKEGEDIFNRKCRIWKITVDDKLFMYLRQKLKVHSVVDFYYLIVQDAKFIDKVKQLINEQKQKKNPLHKIRARFTPKTKKTKEELTNEIEVYGGVDNSLQHSFAACCSPIPGDEIFGFISQNSQDGIRIHKVDCPNAHYLFANYAYRIAEVKWASKQQRHFDTTIVLEGVDSLGLINEVTHEISSHMNLNIVSMNIKAEKGSFDGKIRLSVLDKSQLNQLIAFFKSNPNIHKVSRKDELE